MELLIKTDLFNKKRLIKAVQAAGYKQLPGSGITDGSFIKPIGKRFYPRFHCYIDDSQTFGYFCLSIHYDRWQSFHRKGLKGSCIYNSQRISEELTKIKTILGLNKVTRALYPN